MNARARAGDDRADRRDEKSCRWVQIDDVNGPPASRGGGWLVEVKCECVFMVEERRIEMRRNGGENKNTIRMYILPRFTRFFFVLVYGMLLLSFIRTLPPSFDICECS